MLVQAVGANNAPASSVIVMRRVRPPALALVVTTSKYRPAANADADCLSAANRAADGHR